MEEKTAFTIATKKSKNEFNFKNIYDLHEKIFTTFLKATKFKTRINGKANSVLF